jgi:uncharacterized protein YndB with AHSA1/START domain
MRYSDCPTIEVDTYVDAPPPQLWALVTDIDLPARFSSEFQGGRWLDDVREPSVGARFHGRQSHAAIGEWETISVVVACQPERVFGWAVGDASRPSASWRFLLEPEGTGTRLRQWAQMGPGPSGLTAAIEAMPDKEERIIARRIAEWRDNMLATITGIKAMAEGAPG